MNIMIAGGGRIGSALATRLVGEGHAVTVIERDKVVCDRLFEQIGVVAIHGDASDPRVLESAGVQVVDIAAGVLARDADNLAFAMLVRANSGARVMVRMLDSAYAEAYQLAGVRQVIPEAELVVSRISTSIHFPQVTGSLPLPTGDAMLFELPIGHDTLVAGKTVAEVRAESGFPVDCNFILLMDAAGRIELPTGASVLRGGSAAILVTRSRELGQAVLHLTAEPSVTPQILRMIETLGQVDFLGPLTADELAALARGVALIRKAAGEYVFHKGEIGESLYLPLSGAISMLDDDGKEIEVVKAGGFFGELSLLTGATRSATAKVIEDAELAAIGKDAFRRVVMANPTVALEMSRILGGRLAVAARRMSASRQKRTP